MVNSNFNVSGLVLRFLGALLIVYATYNPFGYSYYDWALADMSTGHAPAFNALKVFVGIVLLIGWFVFLKVTQRALGPLGIVLTLALFGSLIWVMIEYRLISVQSTKALTHVILIVLSAVLAVGMSWAHLRRRVSGEVMADDVDR